MRGGFTEVRSLPQEWVVQADTGWMPLSQRGRAGEGDEVDPDVVNRLFGSAHSLRALAGLFGFDPIRRPAHQHEEMLRQAENLRREVRRFRI
jgi:chemotaxis protein histidine kinase CheA